jgi:uncharacterized delta-60 repeat protein
VPRNYIARINANGSLDETFDPGSGPDDVVDCIAIQSDGKILIGGRFNQVNGVTRNLVARLNADGLVDMSFVPPPLGGNIGFPGEVYTIRLQADNAVLIGGYFDYYDGIGEIWSVMRLNVDGSRDDQFAAGGGGPRQGVIHGLAVQPDGKIIVAGTFQSYDNIARNNIARINADGTLDNSFGLAVRGYLGGFNTIALQPDGKVLVGGAQFTINDDNDHYYDIARLNSDGLIDDTFSCTPSGYPGGVNAIDLRSDGTILIGGGFTDVNDVPRNTVAHITENGALELDFNPGVGPNDSVLAVASQADERVLIGGYFTSVDGIPRNNITRLLAPAPPTVLGNISTRLSVGTGDNVLIGGFIVTGSEPKQVIVRAIGPSLPLPGALADPLLELHDSTGALIETNNDWVNSPNKQEIIDSTIPPTDDKESAILRTLDPGAYTAVVSGAGGSTGIALVEVYDLDQAVNSVLANISTRGFVQTVDDVMIGGLIVSGPESTRYIIRAIGPSLPLTGVLADPVLELHDKDGAIIASNDNWRSDQEEEIIATTIPPSSDAESAIVATLNPEAYTAIVRGKNNTIGIALVEAYQLDL